MNRITALYIRLSTEDYKVESMSIDNQKLALHKFVDSIGELANCEVREFVDNGYSGTNFERPAVQELLNMVREGTVACIVVKDFSRFGRDSLEVGYFMEKVFPLYGVRFISVNDDFDSGKLHNDTGGLNVAFKYLISEFYSRDLSMKYKSAKYVKFKRGEYQSKICPYGYQKSADGRMEPDPETAPNVLMIFEMAAQRENTAAIIKALFDRGIPTPGEYKKARGQANHDVSRSGGIWHGTTISRILYDERYTGTYIIGKRECVEVGSNHVRLKDESQWIKIHDHHPAIITKELYERVQKILNHSKGVKKQAHVYPLRGKVYCGCCLHAMARYGKNKHRFVCRHSQVDESAACHGLAISETELDKLLYDIMEKQAQIVLGAANIDSIGSAGALAAEHAEYNRQINEIQGQKRSLFEHLILRELDEQEYKKRKAALDAELARLQETQAVLSARLSQQQAGEKTKSANKELAQEVMGAERLSSALVDALIDRVYVYPGTKIKIVWKTKNFCMEEM